MAGWPLCGEATRDKVESYTATTAEDVVGVRCLAGRTSRRGNNDTATAALPLPGLPAVRPGAVGEEHGWLDRSDCRNRVPSSSAGFFCRLPSCWASSEYVCPEKSKGTSVAALVVSIVGVVVFVTVVSGAFSDGFGKSDLSKAPTGSVPSLAASAAARPDAESNEIGSRANPYPIGQAVTNKEWNITLAPPREASKDVLAENQFNDLPKPGMQFWIVPVTATYVGKDTGNTLFGIDVKFVGSDNRTHDDRCGVNPNAMSDVGDLYPGGSATGNVCVAVPSGAPGLWALSTGFGDPVFFETR
jgi:hypothetical protein